MDTADNHVDYAGLEIWKNKIDVKNKIEAEYVIGHSLGANFALMNWEKNKNTKLILFNPLLPKKSFLFWFVQWLRFLFTEGSRLNKKRLTTFPHFFSGMKLSCNLLSKDLLDIINIIPRENLVIVRGERDEYFLDKKTVGELKLKDIKIIEVAGIGHNWNEKFNIEIDKIVTGP